MSSTSHNETLYLVYRLVCGELSHAKINVLLVKYKYVRYLNDLEENREKEGNLSGTD